MKANIIAIANHKGGVGKTTTTASIGAILSRKGKRVLLVDLDAQANLTTSLHQKEEERTIYNSFKEGNRLPIVSLSEGLDLVCSCLDMAGVELDISSQMSREFILKELLEPERGRYDFILLDCPPSLGLVTLNALVAADSLFIPLTAEALPAKGLKMLTDIVAKVNKRLNPTLSVAGVIITRYKRTKLSQMVEEQLGEMFGAALFKTKIRENVAIAEAPLFSQDIITYSPDSKGAADYNSLSEEIMERYCGE